MKCKYYLHYLLPQFQGSSSQLSVWWPDMSANPSCLSILQGWRALVASGALAYGRNVSVCWYYLPRDSAMIPSQSRLYDRATRHGKSLRIPLLAIPEAPIKSAPAMAVPEVSASAVTECPVSASPPLSLASGVWVVPQCLCILRGCQTLVASGSLVWGSDICIWQYYCLSGDHICKCNVNSKKIM